MKRQMVLLLMAAIGGSLILASCAGRSDPVRTELAEEESKVLETEASAKGKKAETRLEDDYYGAVNRDILKQMKIPSDESGWTWFYELGNQAYETLNTILLETVKKKDQLRDGSGKQRIAALYLTAMDSEGRNQAGLGRLSDYLSRIRLAEDVEEYIKAIASIQKETGYGSLLSWELSPDLKKSAKNAAYIEEPDLVIGKVMLESEEYETVRTRYQTYIAQILEGAGNSHEESLEAAKEILQFQTDLASQALSPAESGNPANRYHPFTGEELKNLFTNIDPVFYMEASGMDQAETYVVVNPKLESTVNRYLTKEHLPLLKKYSEFILLHDTAQYLTTGLRDQKLQFQKVLSGKEEVYPEQKLAGKLTQNLLGFEFGKIYVGRCFTRADKKNIESMVQTIIKAYEERIQALDWMGGSTKKAAIKKLETMTLKIGYPDQWPDVLDHVKLKYPEDGGVLINNVLEIKKAYSEDMLKRAKQPVDHGEWFMTPQTVNAYYNPQNNEIVFPAAILQPPFYDNKADYKQNLGGIGMVIAHEITHAFDNNGALYDEKGNYNNWWEDEDYQNFKKRQEEVVEYYNGYGVDGRLTLGENIADLGALSCVAGIAGTEDQKGLQRLFEQYASVWASKYTPEEEKNRLKNDPHSPGKVRVNAVLSALDSFYKAYDIKETDNMYTAPEKRVNIWGQ